ncbi:hypothetical protein CXF83_16205 [Shewanella sp. Choline-02u-19]|uniref:hypothetical protein n=1 Tax=Shewanella sp. Choline-02u-19 TaxID=2058309 RepID=UPI000C3320C5|nr:hypothetical protein [Shewanella sp. Choline-02u-19]PKI28145.1 hypothetical protein CXF83_16205 [Shewanella sp. Choline-02u-19]
MHQYLHSKEVVLALDIMPTFEDFCVKIKVKPNSFSKRIVWKIYREIFILSTDYSLEYSQFYSVEYGSFSEFICKTLGCEVGRDLLDRKHVFIIQPNFQLLDENYGGSYFGKVLEILSEKK